MNEPAKSTPPESFGRYVLHAPIARGGMATVHTARLIGAEGFSRLVAAKRLHPQFTCDPDFVAMFHDEARIASKIHHPNVVPVLDVVLAGQEVILVQEYVHGVPLHKLFKVALLKQDSPIPVDVVMAIVGGVLAGLHAAHETKDDVEEPLHIVHRDVSPQNVIVTVDGIPRLLDFGIAKARSSSHVTREGYFKGKIAYMAPEQLRGEDVTRTADVYACGVLLWELLVHRRIHSGRGETELFNAVLTGAIPTLTEALAEVRPLVADTRWSWLTVLEPIVSRALSTNPERRFETAADMLEALLKVCRAATPIEVAQWVKTVGAEYLDERHKVLASNEESWRSLSKIRAASFAAITGPESGVKLSAAHTTQTVAPTAASLSPPEPGSAPDKRAHVPWLVTAGLLLVVGVLIGVLSVRGSSPQPASSVAVPPPPEATLPTTPPVIARAPDPPAVVVVPPPKPPRPPPVAVVAAPPPRPVPPPPRAPAPPATHAASTPSASAAPSGTSALSAKSDCSPPFYFEGSKKLYKPSCL